MIITSTDNTWTCLEAGCQDESHEFPETFVELRKMLKEHWKLVHGADLDVKNVKCLLLFGVEKITLSGSRFQHWFEIGRKKIIDFPQDMRILEEPMCVFGRHMCCVLDQCPTDQTIHFDITSNTTKLFNEIKEHCIKFHGDYGRLQIMVKIRGEDFWSTVGRQKFEDWIKKNRMQLSFEDYMFMRNGGKLPGQKQATYTITKRRINPAPSPPR